ncbi:MAG TPA: adenine phosphoribosyltransferase [Longimicrobiales bacterium]|nr:adenine phosphoribosyltransferase [Longimicrobiales bacterium]
MSSSDIIARVRAAVRDVPDFPQPGIIFKDITPVLGDAVLFNDVVDHLVDRFRSERIDVVAGIESRGFIFGAPIATRLGAGFVPIRKPGKLPAQRVRVDYALEYGTDALEAHADAITPGQRVLIVDDVLATGGTAGAAARLIQLLKGEVVGFCILIELSFLNGRRQLNDTPLHTLITY